MKELNSGIKRKVFLERLFLARPDSFAILAIKVKGDIKLDQLKLGLIKLREKFPILGTRLYMDMEHKMWLVSDDVPEFPIKVIENVENEDWIQNIIEDYKYPFPQEKGPLTVLFY